MRNARARPECLSGRNNLLRKGSVVYSGRSAKPPNVYFNLKDLIKRLIASKTNRTATFRFARLESVDGLAKQLRVLSVSPDSRLPKTFTLPCKYDHRC